MENTQKLTLNVGEVCELLGLSRPIVTAYIRRKDNPLPCIYATGRKGRHVIPRAALEQWLIDEANRCQAAAARR